MAERARPLSPHLLHWRWHITLFASIATRITGGATYVGMLYEARARLVVLAAGEPETL